MRRLMRATAAVGLTLGLGGAEWSGAAPRTPAEEAVVAALDTMIRAEYRSGAELARLLSAYGPASPFFSFVHEDDLHFELIAALYRGRGLRVPPVGAELAPARTVVEACGRALGHARRNLERYDGYLARDLPRDVRRVFEHNRRALAHAHAPALERCAAERGPTRERGTGNGGP